MADEDLIVPKRWESDREYFLERLEEDKKNLQTIFAGNNVLDSDAIHRISHPVSGSSSCFGNYYVLLAKEVRTLDEQNFGVAIKKFRKFLPDLATKANDGENVPYIKTLQTISGRIQVEIRPDKNSKESIAFQKNARDDAVKVIGYHGKIDALVALLDATEKYFSANVAPKETPVMPSNEQKNSYAVQPTKKVLDRA